MDNNEGKKELEGADIKNLIVSIVSKPEITGFEVYVITKTEPFLKRMYFYEGKSNNLREKLKETIMRVLLERFSSSEAEYVSADRIADEQHKFYIIETGEKYNPLAVLKTESGFFDKADISDATGIAFLISSNGKQLWAYQHLWPMMLPNKSKKNWMARMISDNEGVIFQELSEPIISFSEKIDLLVIDDYIITSDYNLLQKSFGFQDYIRLRANKAIETIENAKIVANVDKLREYIQRGDGKPKYAKKMMRIVESRVLKMQPKNLWDRIHKSSRWKGRIKVKKGKIVLDYYTDVENLIDLLDERYTRSDITDTEYDTDVKQIAEPIERT